MIEEEKVDDDNNESLLLLPPEERANIKPPATPLGKKVMSEGWEEGPNEGEVGQGLNARFLPRPKHASHFAWPK